MGWGVSTYSHTVDMYAYFFMHIPVFSTGKLAPLQMVQVKVTKVGGQGQKTGVGDVKIGYNNYAYNAC